MKIFLFQVLFRVNTKMSNTLINIMLIYLGVVAASAVAAATGTRGAQFCSDQELQDGTELQHSAPPFTLEVRLQHTTASGIQTTRDCLPGRAVLSNQTRPATSGLLSPTGQAQSAVCTSSLTRAVLFCLSIKNQAIASL